MNDEGMRLYKERNYAEALNRFTEAVKLDPNSSLFANNLAFTLFKVQQYEQSVQVQLNRKPENVFLLLDKDAARQEHTLAARRQAGESGTGEA